MGSRMYFRAAMCSLLLLLPNQVARAQDSLSILVQYTNPLTGKWVVVRPASEPSKVGSWREQLEAITDTTALPDFVASYKNDGLIAAGFFGAQMISFAPPLISDYFHLRKRRFVSVEAQVDPQQALEWLVAASAMDSVPDLVKLLNTHRDKGLLGIIVPGEGSARPITFIRYGAFARSPQVEDRGGVTLAFSKMQPGDLEKALKQHKTVKDPVALTALAREYLDHGFMTSRIPWMVPEEGSVMVTVWANSR